MGESKDGIIVFTQRIGYWRFIQNFCVDDQSDENVESDRGLHVTSDKRIFYMGKLIAKYEPE